MGARSRKWGWVGGWVVWKGRKRQIQQPGVTTRPKRVWMPPANPGTRARAPLPSLRPLQVLLVYGGGIRCVAIYRFFGAEEMDFGLSEISNVEIRF
jgi:hypothetical protein